MILRNIAYKLIDGTEKHSSSEEYENSAMELVDVTSRSDLNVIKIKQLKCGNRLTADPQFTDQTSNLKPIVFYSPSGEKGNYPKKVKYDLYFKRLTTLISANYLSTNFDTYGSCLHLIFCYENHFQ